MKRAITSVLAAMAAVAATVRAETAAQAAPSRPIKACVLQPPYGMGTPAIETGVRWELDQLKKCDPSLDLIVLPEASDRQGRADSAEECNAAARRHNGPLLAACSETAKRCGATLFVNAMDYTPDGPRNTTFAFDRTGACVGRYYKEHLVASEHKVSGFDASYMWKWTKPTILEIDGIRYAFLTCYDFYFYENFANIARLKPDVIIGCSHQRSDPHPILEMIGKFLAYNTGAYLVRASVSMGLDSPVGGGSMVVAPSGEMLGNMFSRVGTLTVEFDPHAKYLKPMGYGNPPGLHSTYIDVTAQKKWLGLWMYDRVLTIRVDSAGIPYGSHGNRIGDVGDVRESRCTCHAMPSKRQLKMWRPWRENGYWQLNYRVA